MYTSVSGGITLCKIFVKYGKSHLVFASEAEQYGINVCRLSPQHLSFVWKFYSEWLLTTVGLPALPNPRSPPSHQEFCAGMLALSIFCSSFTTDFMSSNMEHSHNSDRVYCTVCQGWIIVLCSASVASDSNILVSFPKPTKCSKSLFCILAHLM